MDMIVQIIDTVDTPSMTAGAFDGSRRVEVSFVYGMTKVLSAMIVGQEKLWTMWMKAISAFAETETKQGEPVTGKLELK